MEHVQENLQATSNSKTHRWLLQGLLCICFAGRGFFMVGFIVASRRITEYFQGVTSLEYEILSGFGYIFGIPVAAVIATNGSSVRPRQLAIASTCFLLLAAVFSSVGFMSTSSFWLVVLGWIAAGVASAIIFAIPVIMADMSFSEDFAVVTYGLAFASMYLGAASSYITFTKLSNALPNEAPELLMYPKYLVTQTFVRGFGVMTLILFASAILVCLCFTDDSAYRQESTTDDTDNSATRVDSWSDCFNNFRLHRLLRPFEETRVVLLLAATFFSSSAQAYSFLIMPDILSYLHPIALPRTLATIYACGMFGGILGCCIAAYMSMRYSWPHVFSAASALITLVLSMGLYGSCYGGNLIGASICSVLLSFTASHLIISLLVDFLSLCDQHLDRITMVSTYFAFYNTGVMLFNWSYLLFRNLGIANAYLLLITTTLFPIPFIAISTKWPLKSRVDQVTGQSNSPCNSANETTSLTATICTKE